MLAVCDAHYSIPLTENWGTQRLSARLVLHISPFHHIVHSFDGSLSFFKVKPGIRIALVVLTVACYPDAAAAARKAEVHEQRIFNYRLSRARRVAENAFGILAQKWRVLRRPFRANDLNINMIIAACVVLHNFM
ncbi:unnamed protein product, partial [Ixodes pacificus]